MTLDQPGQFYAVSCDFCPDGLELPATGFEAAVAALRDAGWRSVKARDGSWEHACPACQQRREQGALL